VSHTHVGGSHQNWKYRNGVTCGAKNSACTVNAKLLVSAQPRARADSSCTAGNASTIVQPTARQAVTEVQDTAPRLMATAPAGWATCRRFHVVPFHESATVPTATQEVAETQDTPSSSLPAGLGAADTDQAVPFQDSANAPVPLRPVRLLPTATQASCVGQDTANKLAEPFTRGVGATAQVAPCHDSTRGAVTVALDSSVEHMSELEDTVRALEERIKQFEDQRAIYRLVSSYDPARNILRRAVGAQLET